MRKERRKGDAGKTVTGRERDGVPAAEDGLLV